MMSMDVPYGFRIVKFGMISGTEDMIRTWMVVLRWRRKEHYFIGGADGKDMATHYGLVLTTIHIVVIGMVGFGHLLDVITTMFDLLKPGTRSIKEST